MKRNQVKIRRIALRDDRVMSNIIRENLKKYHLDILGTAYFDKELDHLSRYYSNDDQKRAYFVAETMDGET